MVIDRNSSSKNLLKPKSILPTAKPVARFRIDFIFVALAMNLIIKTAKRYPKYGISGSNNKSGFW